MAILTISLEEKYEKILRSLAEKKKGSLSRKIKELIEVYIKQKKPSEIFKKFFFKKPWKKIKREDIWKRSWTQWSG